MIAFMDGKKNSSVSSTDVEAFFKKKIASYEKSLKSKKAELAKLQSEIDSEQQELEKYTYALEKLDLKVLANEMNSEKK